MVWGCGTPSNTLQIVALERLLWLYIEVDVLVPLFSASTEPTSCQNYRRTIGDDNVFRLTCYGRVYPKGRCDTIARVHPVVVTALV